MERYYEEYELFSNYTNLEIISDKELLKENKIKMTMVSDSVPYAIQDDPVEITIDLDVVIEDLQTLLLDLQKLKKEIGDNL